MPEVSRQDPHYTWGVDDPRGYKNMMGRYKTAREAAFLDAHLKGDSLRILDIGGGAGRFAGPLTDRGHNVTVIDRSPEAIRRLQGLGRDNIDARCGDFLDMAEGETFDAIIAIESIQYFFATSLTDVFSKVRRLLTSRGTFVFSALNRRSWRYRLHTLRRMRLPYVAEEPQAYAIALQAAGLVPNEVRGFMWMPFPVTSDSPLVPVAAAIEGAFDLGGWVAQSPWLLIAAQPDRVSSAAMDHTSAAR